MTRLIKFRAWNEEQKHMLRPELLEVGWLVKDLNHPKKEVMQFTGILDKSDPCKEVYEGDIIDVYGKITGNKYEMEQGETDLLIKGIGTSAWSKTEVAGLGRGLRYAI